MRVKQLGDPVLREVSKSVEISAIQSGQHQQTLEEMKSILNGIQSISSENGNAISAPQVGAPIRLVLLRVEGEFLPMFNPSFEALDNETFLFEEECFSFYQIRGKVVRYLNIRVDYVDEKGESQSIKFSGEFSGIAQHEIDHLDGVLFIDRVEDSKSIRSIDFVFAEQPQRLVQVKKMFDYMVG
ncbi:peptide deformylase [Aliikangiella marina]|uniref:Peptide deformylase n=1 Tax=Aliikangiella marina TaxID=1712262 RepID=A0A545TBG3_9GAMM|nr:peptide deformylase [Aliikangiella marina]TQV74560.1 peptide deformylase [Aliikangiella marina]